MLHLQIDNGVGAAFEEGWNRRATKTTYDFEGNVTKGEPLPRKQHRLLVAWIELHRDELEANWELASRNEPAHPIAPLAL